MAGAMLGPVVVILGLSRVGLSDTLPWLSNSEHTAMLLGMLAIMLYRREQYTGGTRCSRSPIHRAQDVWPVRVAPLGHLRSRSDSSAMRTVLGRDQCLGRATKMR